MENKKINRKNLIKEIGKKLTTLKSICEEILKKYPKPEKMSHKEYVYFIFSSSIIYRTKDLLLLNKKLTEAKNNFDSSLYVLSRAIIEEFFYISYLLSEPDKIEFRLEAFTCYNAELNIKHFTCLINLGDKNKYIFSEDPQNGLSRVRMEEKITEHRNYIKKHVDHKKGSKDFLDEIQRFKSTEQICQRYDSIKGINSVEKGIEVESLEWLYNFIYRFQSMSVHQNLNDKEKVFNLYLNKKTEPDNVHILSLTLDILEKIIKLK